MRAGDIADAIFFIAGIENFKMQAAAMEKARRKISVSLGDGGAGEYWILLKNGQFVGYRPYKEGGDLIGAGYSLRGPIKIYGTIPGIPPN